MDKAIIFGGSGYNWRGNAIRTIIRNKESCVAMPRMESFIITPCFVEPNKDYIITITASKNSGNGTIVVDFIESVGINVTNITINIDKNDINEYTGMLQSPNSLESMQTYIKISRPNTAISCIFIQTVKIESAPSICINKKEIKELLNVRSNGNEKLVKMENYPKVSIITPTRSNLQILKKCCKALIANTYYPNWEWVIGDSNSKDGTVEYIKTLNDKRIILVERNTTSGSYSEINNELVKFATGDLYLFLNDDTEPQPFWLFEMAIKLCRDPNVGIVGARLEYSKDIVQHAGIAIASGAEPVNIGNHFLKVFPAGFANYNRYLQAVTGACLLIRKNDFEIIKGFDNAYSWAYEDVDLCLKVGNYLNKKILYAANAIVIHHESISQAKFKTNNPQEGIKIFRKKWQGKITADFDNFKKDINFGRKVTDISFVTCLNNFEQYKDFVISSLLRNNTQKQFDIIPIFNFNNPYSAAQALNAGIDKSISDIVVLCHQDVSFYEPWIDTLFACINEIEKITQKWGVLGTAGISPPSATFGVVYNKNGDIQWKSHRGKSNICPVQTLDEHCLVIKKSNGLTFDEKFNGFHFYGADICLEALNKGMQNYGIWCPLVHNSTGSLVSGKKEFMRLLDMLSNKWKNKFDTIRTTTSIIQKGIPKTFINFGDKI